MKKQLLCDILRITVMYGVFAILIVLFDHPIPGIFVILVGYLVSLGILLFFDYQHAKKQVQFDSLLTKYETVLPPDKWTQVYLRTDINEKIGIFYAAYPSSEKFYAKSYIDSGVSPWGVPILRIHVVILQDDEEITEDTPYHVSYDIEEFEEHFCLIDKENR